jgi:hypothetical protein
MGLKKVFGHQKDSVEPRDMKNLSVSFLFS